MSCKKEAVIYGYKRVNGRYETIEEQAATVQLISKSLKSMY